MALGMKATVARLFIRIQSTMMCDKESSHLALCARWNVDQQSHSS